MIGNAKLVHAAERPFYRLLRLGIISLNRFSRGQAHARAHGPFTNVTLYNCFRPHSWPEVPFHSWIGHNGGFTRLLRTPASRRAPATAPSPISFSLPPTLFFPQPRSLPLLPSASLEPATSFSAAPFLSFSHTHTHTHITLSLQSLPFVPVAISVNVAQSAKGPPRKNLCTHFLAAHTLAFYDDCTMIPRQECSN